MFDHMSDQDRPRQFCVQSLERSYPGDFGERVGVHREEAARDKRAQEAEMEAHESATLIQCAVRCWIARNSMYELEGLRELRREGRTLSLTDPGQGGEGSRVKDLEEQLHASREMMEESMSAQAALQERVNALNRENGELRRQLQEGGGGGGGDAFAGDGRAADQGILIELEVQKKLVQQLLAETRRKDEMLSAPVDPSSFGASAGGSREWEEKCSKLEKQMEKLKESHAIALEIKG